MQLSKIYNPHLDGSPLLLLNDFVVKVKVKVTK